MGSKRIKIKYIGHSTNHKYLFNIYNILLLLFTFLTISKQTQCLDKINKLLSDTEIILTIRGRDNQQILFNDFYLQPSKILINENEINEKGFYVYNLTLDENNITIIFNITLTNCNSMFYGLSNIIKIEFRKFDFSGTNMEKMFYGCKNLISLDLNNFNTSSVTNMGYMFSNCSKLISLDLNNFNTQSVTNMGYMFYDCFNLKELDLSHFNTYLVTNMVSMFSNCTELISLDLNNFNTSSVLDMKCMFYNCNNLKSLYINNFNT